MGSSMLPDSGKSGYDDSNDVGLIAAMARLRDYFGGGDEFADILTELQSRYRPPSTVPMDSQNRAGSESHPAEANREYTVYQRRCRQQISDGVERAITCLGLVASLFAATVFLLEIASIVRLIRDW